ncbi:MAG: hypothetical protein B6U95_03540 [Thermofilum sp. ex4484_82]|nr:MAG: hypothetical protein B6U95_03540 [Thermofilum sp. ex4484_82]OYT38772.1 MAG: hypothetical protein B6U96_03530 [Archaeoglobales archaeon ex4484_92]
MISRLFLVKSSTSHTAADFNIKSFASSSGRMDVIARAIISALRLRNNIRKNVTFLGVLEGPPDPPKLIRACGEELHYLPDCEIEIAKILVSLLKGNNVRGFHLERKSFKTIITEFFESSEYAIYYLEKDGVDIRKASFPSDKKLLFILGDHLGLDVESEKWIRDLKIPIISLGPKFYFTSHCITIVNEELDRLKFFS